MTETVLDAIRDLLPEVRERAQETEDARRVPGATIKALQEAGFLRLLQPARYGGLEADPITHYAGVKLLASACGSTGWVASVVGAHQWHIALFPEQAQDEVWGHDPTALSASSYAPVGRASTTDGGYRLSGRWSFSSGIDNVGWALLGGLVFGEDGQPSDYGAFLVPRSDYAIDDVWNAAGLRGTGSNDVIVDDVIVPAHRFLSFNDAFDCVCPGHEVNTNPLYRLPLFTIMSYTIGTPIFGMAEGAYDAHVAHQRERVKIYFGQNVKDDPFAKIHVARAASDIDAAWLQLVRNITEELEVVRRGEKIPMSMRMRVRRDQVLGASRCIDAIDRMFEISGARAVSAATPIQRFWRDAHAARVHVANDVEPALTMFGDDAFGLPINGKML